MSISEKLTQIAENQQAVYDAGYNAGIADGPKWKLVKTINIMEQEDNFQEGGGDLVEIGDGFYQECMVHIWDLYASLEGLTGLTRVVLSLPLPAAHEYETDVPTNSFTVFMKYWFAGGSEDNLYYYRADRLAGDVVEPLSSIVDIPAAEGCNPTFTGYAVCYIRQNEDGTFTPPANWNLEVYQLEGAES